MAVRLPVCSSSPRSLTGFVEASRAADHRKQNKTLVLFGGKKGEWTPHDLRRPGATMMQQLGVSLDLIDRCQNHVMAGSRARRAYLHHDYEKRDAWERLGKRIDALLGDSDAVPSPSSADDCVTRTERQLLQAAA